ncbi:hypothetical protein C9374_008319 [Naegleria lovaniensis]|uniref:Uncharacterized protein n=1 Tax=Naegleria lovaniensis TaxID=51637 RepID=A0AA88KHG7_NAELO|nr:uncharacterized protein C9374_008319 [Naegleria lovaniensis]KAG2378176.1 hypothetical protein C9374_008319 [Naegleria lovaniensis]
MQPQHQTSAEYQQDPQENDHTINPITIENNEYAVTATISAYSSSESIDLGEMAPLETQTHLQHEEVESTTRSTSIDESQSEQRSVHPSVHFAPSTEDSSSQHNNHNNLNHHQTSKQHHTEHHPQHHETILDRLDDVLDTSTAEDSPSQSKVCDNADLVVDHTTSMPSSTTTSEVSVLENKLESSYNDLKVAEKEEGTSETAPKSAFAKALLRKKIINLILFFLGTMCFKFSYETLSGAIGLTILTRLEGHPVGATTILSLLTITFGISQSISSTLWKDC